jgi:hypothetical protein
VLPCKLNCTQIPLLMMKSVIKASVSQSACKATPCQHKRIHHDFPSQKVLNKK